MNLGSMFKKNNRSAEKRIRTSEGQRGPEVPAGLLRKCGMCGAAILAEEVREGYYICPKCGGYFRMGARRRIRMIADEGSFEEWNRELAGPDPMEFREYEEKLEAAREKTSLTEAVITGKARIDGSDVVLGVCDGRFLMASMGWAVGEKITRAVERATQERLPVVMIICSGGARMQEGIVSLMQMAKTSAAFKRHSDAGLLYLSVLTEPTTGGVTASFAMLGDIILSEPGALIGFAGPRVIEQTIGQKLPKGFQRAEFLLEHGFVDRIVKREEMKAELSRILKLHEKGEWENGKSNRSPGGEYRCNPAKLSAWERVGISRKKDRPVGSDYIDTLFTDFTEFHGDRNFADDHAIIGGIGRFHGHPVTVIVQAKGKNTKENLDRNFSMPSPEGYRKALRLMKQAEKFRRPILCFVDTPGAFCGMEAEERGQGEAIARNLFEMISLKVPVLSVVIGEGGSGGALALAVADEVWMLENAVYSVLSPEGFASILWKDSSRASEAAEVMKLTAEDLKRQNIVEQVIPEPEEYTEKNLGEVTKILEEQIETFLKKYGDMTAEERSERRYERFRRM